MTANYFWLLCCLYYNDVGFLIEHYFNRVKKRFGKFWVFYSSCFINVIHLSIIRSDVGHNQIETKPNLIAMFCWHHPHTWWLTSLSHNVSVRGYNLILLWRTPTMPPPKICQTLEWKRFLKYISKFIELHFGMGRSENISERCFLFWLAIQLSW